MPIHDLMASTGDIDGGRRLRIHPAKRLIDLFAGSLLLILATPVCLPIMLVLACTGEREVFYAQERVGQGGRAFRLLKFATMMKNSEKVGTGTVTVVGDPRVLPFGRFLRKAKLNELPQILNLLRGDMTLVGPRPLTKREFSFYAPEVQATIRQVRPGLTGIGSVVFRDEEAILAKSTLPPLEAYRQEISPRKGSLESWYVAHQNLWLDSKLLALTGIAVLFPRSRLHERWLPDLPRPSLKAEERARA